MTPRAGDLLALARVLLTRAPGDRDALARAVVADARAAAAFVRRNGRPHPVLGDGSVMAAALSHGPAPEPALDDRDFAGAIVTAVGAICPDIDD